MKPRPLMSFPFLALVTMLLVCALGGAALAEVDAGAAAPAVAEVSGAATTPTVPAVVTDPGTDPIGFAATIWKAVVASNWFLVAALALVAIVYVLRKWILPRASKVGWLRWAAWFGTDPGGVVLVFLAAVAGGLVVSAGADKRVTLVVLFAAAKVGIAAIGGFVGIKKALAPLLKRLGLLS